MPTEGTQHVRSSVAVEQPTKQAPRTSTPHSALENLPVSQILRTYLITSISSSPFLLDSSSALLQRMLDSQNALTNVETNPVLRAVLWETFYKQFCAGETAEQINRTCDGLRRQGYAGLILEYAREVLKDSQSSGVVDIAAWRDGMLRTIEMAASGDFIGLKWSGMGPAALRRLAADEKPSAAMLDAMHNVCSTAAAKDIAILPAAEETSTLDGFHAWSLLMQEQYNRQGKSVVYTTYQAYLRQTPGTIGKHLAMAKDQGFTLGAKLVRGAYLATEEKQLLQPTIEATHAAYDASASALIHREYNDIVPSFAPGAMPDVNVVLATHNAESVRKATEARMEQSQAGKELTPLCFAQLQGMADEVSCSLLNAVKSSGGGVSEKVLKCAAWGTMSECLGYLIRRAAENKDAASRTADTRWAMRDELVRRLRRTLMIQRSSLS